MPDDYKPRFSFEITEEQKTKANELISTHGIRRAVFSIILDDVLNLIESHGNMAIGIILDGAAKPREILPSMAKVEKKGGNNG